MALGIVYGLTAERGQSVIFYCTAGTGSIVLGKNEEEKIIRNYDFHHDSEAGARYLAYWSIYELITHVFPEEDNLLYNDVLDYWGVSDLNGLRNLAAVGFAENKIDAIKRLSGMGEIVTNAAVNGSGIAFRACEKVAQSLIIGIELVAANFHTDKVPLAFAGGVSKSPVVKKIVLEGLKNEKSLKDFSEEIPQLPSVLGAILCAYGKLEMEVPSKKIEKLKSYSNLDGY